MSRFLTGDELAYMRDLAQLDSLRLGMLDPGAGVNDPDAVRDSLASRGWVRVLPDPTPYGKPVVELTTRGHRMLQRIERVVARV